MRKCLNHRMNFVLMIEGIVIGTSERKMRLFFLGRVPRICGTLPKMRELLGHYFHFLVLCAVSGIRAKHGYYCTYKCPWIHGLLAYVPPRVSFVAKNGSFSLCTCHTVCLIWFSFPSCENENTSFTRFLSEITLRSWHGRRQSNKKWRSLSPSTGWKH